VIAELADLEEVLDVELVDRVDAHPRGSWSTGLAGYRNFKCHDFRRF
jgi:hypothetical protein